MWWAPARRTVVSGEKNLEGSEKNVVGGGASEESVVGGEMSVVTARRTWWAAHCVLLHWAPCYGSDCGGAAHNECTAPIVYRLLKNGNKIIVIIASRSLAFAFATYR